MRYFKYLSVLFIFFISLISHTQNFKKKNYFPIWTFHQDSININGISIGFLNFETKPKLTKTNGIRLDLIGSSFFLPLVPGSPLAKSDKIYENIMAEPFSEIINGINLSGAGTSCSCLFNGITIGLIGHMNNQVNGISLGGLANSTQKHNGMMMAFVNEAYYMNGLQIGLINHSNYSSGIQIGLINNSTTLKGIQIGLWNKNQKRKLPIINWSF